jgi:TonB family protein
MACGRCKRALAALTCAALGLSQAIPAAARDGDDLAASRQAYAKAASGSAERQEAALRLARLLLRRATDSTGAAGQTPVPDRANPAELAVPAELAEAEALFREAVAGGGHGADEGEAGLIAAMLARGPAGAADAGTELERLQRSGRGGDVFLCLAMQDLIHGIRDRDAAMAANDQINDRVHALLPAAPYLVSARVSRPEPLSTPTPRYTFEARKYKLRGSVFLEAVVDRQGHVADLLVLKPGPFTLTDSATKTVRTWTYRPALRDGQPVAVCSAPVLTFDVQR